MKEIIKKIVIAVVAVIALGVAVFSLINDEPAVTPGVADPSVSTTDSGNNTPTPGTNGDTTSDKGNTPATKPNGGSNVQEPSATAPGSQTTTGTETNAPTQSQPGSTTQSAPAEPDAPTQSPTQSAPVEPDATTQNAPEQTTAPNGDAPATQPVQPDNSDVQQSTLSPSVPQAPNSSQTQPTQPAQPSNKISAYQEIFKSGKFLMKVNDPDLGPVTMAMSGNKMFIEASMEGMSLKMLYDGDTPDSSNPDTGTWYIIIDKIKKYSPISSDMIGDMNVEELTKDIAKGDGSTVYTKSTETLNGETYECESCTDENGNITKYYFKGDQLVRSDSISPSGEVSTTEFQEISATVDENLFIIPDSYNKWDISWLMNMVGGE